MPPIGFVLGNVDFSQLQIELGKNAAGEVVAIRWGLLVNAIIVFVVVALVVYWIARSSSRRPTRRPPSPEETLLTEIRDELRKRPV